MKYIRHLFAALTLLLAIAASALGQTWQPLLTSPLPQPLTTALCNPLLLTDGSVMMQENGTNAWWRLFPDANGNYATGNWVQTAPMDPSYTPSWFGSAVLQDGRVLVIGGQQNGANPLAGNTNKAEIYDPVTNTWKPVPPPLGWTTIGSASVTVLGNGKVLVSRATTSDSAILDPVTLTWTALAPRNETSNLGEPFGLLQDGSVLTIELHTFFPTNQGTDRFIPSATGGSWGNPGGSIPFLIDFDTIGFLATLPNGNVFTVGSGNTAVLNPSTGIWQLGPSLPSVGGNQLLVGEARGCVLPSGKVFFSAAPGIFGFGLSYFESDGQSLIQTATSPAGADVSTSIQSMVLLPTGQVLETTLGSSVSRFIYTPGGAPLDAWRPSVSNCPAALSAGQTYSISGTQFNGLTQGSIGDNYISNATNYPLVRVTNISTGHVAYCRTFGHSTMAIATGSIPTSTNLTVPSTIESGPSMLEVVTNGIASTPVAVTVAGITPGPVIDALTPSSAAAGSPDLTVTVDGANFSVDDAVTWTSGSNSTALATAFVSGQELTVTVPAALLSTVGTASIQVVRGDGVASAPATFTIFNDAPVLNSVSPNSVQGFGPDFTLSLIGLRFDDTDSVRWTFNGVTTNLSTTFLSASSLSALVPAAAYAGIGTATVVVVNARGEVSDSANVAVTGVLPILISIDPTSVPAGSPSYTMTLTGSNFSPNTVAEWQASVSTTGALTTTYVSSTTLLATVPASLVAAQGKASVFVTTPGVGSSLAKLTVTITGAPTLSAITPSTTTAGASFTMTLKGTGFIDGSQVSVGGTLLPASFVSSTSLTANIPGSSILTAGSYPVLVVSPGGSRTNSVNLNVQNPSPKITSLSPASAKVGAGAFTLTINGTGFVPTSQARWNGAGLATTYVSPTQLQATIPATNLAKTGNFTITVLNPSPGGGGSNGVTFTVTP